MSEDRQYESETVLRYDETKDDAYVWSASRVFQRHMEKLGAAPVNTAQREGSAPSMWYRVPKSWIVVRRPAKRELTEEQRQAARERMSRMAKKARSPDKESSDSPIGPSERPETKEEA